MTAASEGREGRRRPAKGGWGQRGTTLDGEGGLGRQERRGGACRKMVSGTGSVYLPREGEEIQSRIAKRAKSESVGSDFL